MKRSDPYVVSLGELIVAFFDIAAQYSTDPKEIADLASKTVLTRLRRVCRVSPAAMPASLVGAGPKTQSGENLRFTALPIPPTLPA